MFVFSLKLMTLTIIWNSDLPLHEKVKTIKEIMDVTADKILKEQIQKRLETVAETKINNDERMTDYQCYPAEEIENVVIAGVGVTGFENANIDVSNPFEYGDIVRFIGDKDSRPGIVITSQERWKERKKRQKKSIIPYNYDSNVLAVDGLDSDGEFYHMNLDIFRLKKITEWGDGYEWNLLQSISDLMKKKGAVETVFGAYQSNKYEKR